MAVSAPVENTPVSQEQVIHDVHENNETCLAKTMAALYTFGQILTQITCNAMGDFLHDETYMYADQRVARLKDEMKYSAEAISQTPFYLERFLKIEPDSTMNSFDLDRAFYGIYTHVHPRLQKAIHYMIWKQALSPDIDPDLFGRDVIEANPRSEVVHTAIRHICSYAEFHREYLPHRLVLYTDDVELDKIVLEGIYNIQLQYAE